MTQARAWLIDRAAGLMHAAIALVGIGVSGYERVDLVSRGRVVVFLQTTGRGRRLSRLIRLLFVPLCLLTLDLEFTPVGKAVMSLRVATAVTFGMLALVGPLAFSALTYRRWLIFLLATAGVVEVIQIAPVVPGTGDVMDFLCIAAVIGCTIVFALYLRWLGRQDFEDAPLWAQPWSRERGAVGVMPHLHG